MTIPVPWGTIAAKAWGNPINAPVLALHGMFLYINLTMYLCRFVVFHNRVAGQCWGLWQSHPFIVQRYFTCCLSDCSKLIFSCFSNLQKCILLPWIGQDMGFHQNDPTITTPSTMCLTLDTLLIVCIFHQHCTVIWLTLLYWSTEMEKF